MTLGCEWNWRDGGIGLSWYFSPRTGDCQGWWMVSIEIGPLSLYAEQT